MEQGFAEHFLSIQELAKHDPIYSELSRKYRDLDDSILDLFSRLSDHDADLVMEYIGLCNAMCIRMMEIMLK